MRQLFGTFLVCVAAVFGVVRSAAAETSECYDDWSIAAPIVRKEGLTTVEDVSKLAKGKLEGNIIKAVLCHGTEGYTYRLIVRRKGGETRMIIIDARQPFVEAEPPR